MLKIPKYIINELQKASNYASKSADCISKFEIWVLENVDENFDFDMLRASKHVLTQDEMAMQTSELTEIEYGNEVDVEELERSLNKYLEWKKKSEK